jgi:hypothetical protein
MVICDMAYNSLIYSRGKGVFRYNSRGAGYASVAMLMLFAVVTPLHQGGSNMEWGILDLGTPI